MEGHPEWCSTGICFRPDFVCYIYFNDIDESVNGRILKFADDTKIYQKVDSDEAINSLRHNLCNLDPVAWSKEWQMLFNIEKCKVMHLGFNNTHAP